MQLEHSASCSGFDTAVSYNSVLVLNSDLPWRRAKNRRGDYISVLAGVDKSALRLVLVSSDIKFYQRCEKAFIDAMHILAFEGAISLGYETFSNGDFRAVHGIIVLIVPKPKEVFERDAFLSAFVERMPDGDIKAALQAMQGIRASVK